MADWNFEILGLNKKRLKKCNRSPLVRIALLRRKEREVKFVFRWPQLNRLKHLTGQGRRKTKILCCVELIIVYICLTN